MGIKKDKDDYEFLMPSSEPSGIEEEFNKAKENRRYDLRWFKELF